MIANKNGPIPRGWFLLLALALLLGGVLPARAAFASTGVAAPPQRPGAAAPTGPLTIYPSTDVPKSIPFNGTVTSTLNIPLAGMITSIEVAGVTITHTFPGDLQVYLKSPAGTEVMLLDHMCAGDDWDATNTGFNLADGAAQMMGETCPPGHSRYKPAQPLSAFNGQQMQGTWTLRIVDDNDEDNGGLLAWGLALPAGAAEPTYTAIVPPTVGPPPSATPCAFSFSDVHTSDYFYGPVGYLFCKGAISGYADGTFRPYANTTRGQMAKIVALGLDVPLFPPPATPHFSDVPRSHPFYAYIEAAYSFGIVSGYADGTFKPQNEITRGQMLKMAVGGAGWNTINPATPHFSDVPTADPFYTFIETGVCYGVVSGYADGTFRPNTNVTRGQTAKIIAITNEPAPACALVPTPIGRPQP